MSIETAEVAIVGGGLAGAALAIRLAAAGREVVVLERATQPRWRACGVFSPTALGYLPELGLSSHELNRVALPIDSLRLVALQGSSFTLAYGGSSGALAAAFARPALDSVLLALAAAAGADVRTGARAEQLTLPGGGGASAEIRWKGADGDSGVLRTELVVGADGIRSLVARTAGVVRRPRVARRIGLSYHVSAPSLAAPRLAAPSLAAPRHRRSETTMFAFRGGYCGLAPVPGGRVNVGIVLEPARWGSRLRLLGARAVAGEILLRLAPRADGLLPLMAPVAPAPLDTVAGAVPLAHAVGRVAGDRWLLVGDAAGFLDPFTGEGIGRAFTTARLAAEAIDEWLSGRRGALDRYDGVVRRRYRGRDRLTWIVQQFLTRPALFEYATRRLATRDALRHTLDAVLAERLPAERAIDPRFLAALLRP